MSAPAIARRLAELRAIWLLARSLRGARRVASDAHASAAAPEPPSSNVQRSTTPKG